PVHRAHCLRRSALLSSACLILGDQCAPMPTKRCSGAGGSMAKYDVAVIGAGAAGLTAGALLAKNGKKVIVLDRSPHLGGRGMAVPDEGFKLNVGAHLLEDSGSGITKGFEYLGKHLG